MKKVFLAFVCLFLISSFFTSCNGEIELTFQKDGNVLIHFTGACQKSVDSLIRSLSEIPADQPLFDSKSIKTSLENSGFLNVDCTASASSIKFSGVDNGSSFLFTSGLLKKDKKLSATISPEILKSFYESADSEIVTYLDLLLAPVFNDEVMSPEEYVEILASFYGEDVASEIKNATIPVKITNPSGEKKSLTISVVDLLSLQKKVTLE